MRRFHSTTTSHRCSSALFITATQQLQQKRHFINLNDAYDQAPSRRREPRSEDPLVKQRIAPSMKEIRYSGGMKVPPMSAGVAVPKVENPSGLPTFRNPSHVEKSGSSKPWTMRSRGGDDKESVRNHKSLFTAYHDTRPQLSETEADKFITNWLKDKWYRNVYHAIKFINPANARDYKTYVHGALSVNFIFLFTILYYSYLEEVEVFRLMEADERRDYKKVLSNARYSDVYPIGAAALDDVDPLRTLPKKKQCSIVVEAFRAHGLVDKDWELDKRTRPTLIREPDAMHIYYWSAMWLGRVLSGNGLFW